HSVSFSRSGDKKAGHKREYQARLSRGREQFCLADEPLCGHRSKNLQCSPSVVYLKTEQERYQYPWPEFNRIYLWEQELRKKYPYEMVVLLVNEYHSHCQDLLHMVRKEELDKVCLCLNNTHSDDSKQL
ncbi:hypothetical protein Q9233_014415, partial [Columba guinea]